jgi:hypothetical protein
MRLDMLKLSAEAVAEEAFMEVLGKSVEQEVADAVVAQAIAAAIGSEHAPVDPIATPLSEQATPWFFVTHAQSRPYTHAPFVSYAEVAPTTKVAPTDTVEIVEIAEPEERVETSSTKVADVDEVDSDGGVSHEAEGGVETPPVAPTTNENLLSSELNIARQKTYEGMMKRRNSSVTYDPMTGEVLRDMIHTTGVVQSEELAELNRLREQINGGARTLDGNGLLRPVSPASSQD